jgi:DNA-binding NarL/FixJ family response regulator
MDFIPFRVASPSLMRQKTRLTLSRSPRISPKPVRRQPPIRILLADDEPSIRQGLRMCLGRQPNMTVIGEAADGRAALAMIRDLGPDIVVMDLQMPHLDGIAVAEQARVLAPQSRVIILSIADDVYTRERARAAGVVALVGKLEGSQALLQAIRGAAIPKAV